MRIFHLTGDQFTELQSLPHAPPDGGFLWIGVSRAAFEQQLVIVQAGLQRWAGGALVDLHVSDLLNDQLPSHFDDTSWYDLLVFRRLTAESAPTTTMPNGARLGTSPAAAGKTILPASIHTSPVGFAVFDQVLLTVHPNDCLVREYFVNRLQQQTPGLDARNTTRLPPNPADMALRMVNHMVDGYLELRRLLTRQLDELQQELFRPGTSRIGWKQLLDARNGLHLLEDTCEDQRAAITEWIDAQDELPRVGDAALLRERELLRVRLRDVLEHIERVLTHVRRLESSAENAVQMHFSAQSNRTNDIMRTLTVLTAIFMPLNLVTGFFGMNFDTLPGIHSPRAFWFTLGGMVLVGGGLGLFFWRKRYLGRGR